MKCKPVIHCKTKCFLCAAVDTIDQMEVEINAIKRKTIADREVIFDIAKEVGIDAVLTMRK